MKKEDLKKLDKIESILTDCQSTLKEIRAKSEQKYEPKVGDFVYLKDKDGDEYIFIFYSFSKNGNIHRYCSTCDGYLFISDTSHIVGFFNDVTEFRPATKEEKQILIDKLHEAGKDWDAENKKFVDYRWRAEKGGEYFRITYKLNVTKDTDVRSEGCSSAFESGNYFKTEEQAEEFRKHCLSYFKK